jgi:hypothetical protein
MIPAEPAPSTEARGSFYQLPSGNRESTAYLPERRRLLAGRGLVNKDLEFRHVIAAVRYEKRVYLHERKRANAALECALRLPRRSRYE